MYNIYQEKHYPDFKLILQGGGGVEVTFCIVNDFVTWKEVKRVMSKAMETTSWIAGFSVKKPKCLLVNIHVCVS